MPRVLRPRFLLFEHTPPGAAGKRQEINALARPKAAVNWPRVTRDWPAWLIGGLEWLSSRAVLDRLSFSQGASHLIMEWTGTTDKTVPRVG